MSLSFTQSLAISNLPAKRRFSRLTYNIVIRWNIQLFCTASFKFHQQQQQRHNTRRFTSFSLTNGAQRRLTNSAVRRVEYYEYGPIENH
jgi:hypothetical protein